MSWTGPSGTIKARKNIRNIGKTQMRMNFKCLNYDINLIFLAVVKLFLLNYNQIIHFYEIYHLTCLFFHIKRLLHPAPHTRHAIDILNYTTQYDIAS